MYVHFNAAAVVVAAVVVVVFVVVVVVIVVVVVAAELTLNSTKHSHPKTHGLEGENQYFQFRRQITDIYYFFYFAVQPRIFEYLNSSIVETARDLTPPF